MTDLILINPYPEDAYGINEGTVEPPLGPAYLGAIAERSGIRCGIIDANVLRMGTDDVLSAVKEAAPRMVGITVNLYTYQTALKLADGIKEALPGVVVIMGGPTPSSTPVKVLDSCRADAVIVGEGEETFEEILRNYKSSKPLFDDINGVVYKDGEEIVVNNPRGFMKEIDDIPMPAYHLLPDLKTYRSRARKKPVAPILTSRGCPYQCVFCSKDVFKNVCRMRTPENIIKEIDMLVSRYGVKQIDILDDNFTLDRKRTERILDLIIDRGYDLYINCQSGVRTESLDQALIDKMVKAKIWKMPIGVESGDPDMLRKIKKRLDLDHVLKVSHMARKAGMIVYGFFIIGLPGDTPESMQKTIDFAKKMDPHIANFCLSIPFPGTELYDMVKNGGGKFLVDIDNGISAGFYSNEVFYEMDGMDRNIVLKYYKKAIRDFYFRPGKMLELASTMGSKEEFKWLVETGFSVLRNMWKKN
ncbi:MAG: radical SAM protein [Candidatus Omnitrophica bacterium]|nr:radical SAM protein [Candidatus Omnitrophota bacterium]MDD5488794.1 radical SAM protein [Candidatus Omnitrophota bacterium]